MNAYIAILKRDLRINGTAYLLLPLFIAIVLSTEQQLSSLYENVTIAVLLPAILGWQQANSLKAMTANPASLLFPKGRIQQFNYSCVFSIAFLVLLPLLIDSAPASILNAWLILSLSVVVLLISFSAALPETANLTGFFMSLVFVWWASDLLGVVYIAEISQFSSVMLLPELLRLSIAGAATLWSVLMFMLFRQAYLAPKELDESRLPHSWLSRTNEKVTLWQSIGFVSPRWLSALVQNWQRRCFLVNPRSLLEKGLYGGERSTNAMTVVLICSCLVLLVMALLSIPARAQGALHSEGWLMVVGMFFTLAAFILSFNLMLEFISLQPTVATLWLLDKSPDRKTYMARVGRSFCLRVLRFYGFFALIFLLLGIAVAGSFSGMRIYFIIISFSAAILPFQLALSFYCAPRFSYRPLLINSLLAITVGIYVAAMLFSKMIIPVGGLMASLTVLGGVGLALTALQYDRWCKTVLELSD